MDIDRVERIIKKAKIKIFFIGLTLSLIFTGLSTFISYQYMQSTMQLRLNHLKQTVELAKNSIAPFLNKYNSGKAEKKETLNNIRDLLRTMTYIDHEGDNYIFMSSYDGIMMVQPFEPEKELSNMLDLKDFYGNYIIRDLIKAAQSEKHSGFVSYFYKKPNKDSAEEKISYVIGIPELECYIGTGQYLTDLREKQHSPFV